MNTTNPYEKYANASNFDLDGYLAQLAADPLFQSNEGRRAMTANDPFAFALIYLTKHLMDADGGVSFSDAHLDWVRQAKRMVVQGAKPAQHRDAYIAPRSMGKSTWFFLIIPMWAAAHGHAKFVAAFADTATQAETHLSTFKHELDTNDLLRADYPELVLPLTRPKGAAVADNRSLYQAKSGFVFAAKGADSSNLGLKVGSQRPDLIVIDDLEPDEQGYSIFQAQKRLSTLLDAILPLNIYARVAMVGTVTMSGSIVHQLVKHARGIGTEDWIKTENFRAHYYPAIVHENNGTERSIWPQKWPLEFLKGIEGTRQYLKNYANDPMGADGDYWRPEDFSYKPVLGITRKIISIDPAVTSKQSSDFTGIAVVGWSPSERKCVVEKAVAVKLSPADIRTYVLDMIEVDPDINGILIETNQGGDVWTSILHHVTVPIKTVHQSVKKEVRAASVLTLYQRGHVEHAEGLTQLEEQMVSFPKGPNDDLVDAVGSAVQLFFSPKSPPRKPNIRTNSYV